MNNGGSGSKSEGNGVSRFGISGVTLRVEADDADRLPVEGVAGPAFALSMALSRVARLGPPGQPVGRPLPAPALSPPA